MNYSEASGRYGLAQFGGTAAADAEVRVLPDGAVVDTLDLAAGPVVAEGSLVVDGDICGAHPGAGPLVVFGDLTVRSLRLGAAVVVVMGDVTASGLVDAGAGEGSLAIRANLTAPLLVAEHKVRVAGDVSVPEIVQFGGLVAGGRVLGKVVRTRAFYAHTDRWVPAELIDADGELRMDAVAAWVVAGKPVLLGCRRASRREVPLAGIDRTRARRGEVDYTHGMDAVIFDMDGVLVDSEPAWKDAEVRVLGSVGVPIDLAATETTKGMRIDQAIQWWFDRHPWVGPSVSEVADAVVIEVAAWIRSNAEPLPGALEAIAVVADAGVPHAIATSSPWPIIEAVVERLALSIEVICSAADEVHGKPHPAVYQRAAERLGVQPSRVIAVEDSRSGTRSALDAGMTVVAVEAVDIAHFQVAGPELPAFLRERLSSGESAVQSTQETP